MTLKSPTFWTRPSFLSKVLCPLSWPVILTTKLRQKLTTPYKVSVPVICIGNVTVGGTGKTPLTIALAALLQQRGFTPHILSRGYGASLKEPILVNPKNHQATDVGDEPLLLAKAAPTWVFPDRRISADLATKAGATILLMDDGFQNPTLYKDIHLLVIDEKQGFGNGKVLPAGPLREPLEEALERADALAIYNHSSQGFYAAKLIFPVKTVSDITPEVNQNYIAFAGIGYPQKFFDSLQEKGFPLLQTVSYPDHFTYDDKTLSFLQNLAETQQAKLITTEKDAVKLPANFLKMIDVFSIRTEFDSSQLFETWLLDHINLAKKDSQK